MICSGMGGKGNALKACDVGDVGDVVGDDAADDDDESIVVVVIDLLFLKTGDEQGFADTNLGDDVRRVIVWCRDISALPRSKWYTRWIDFL